MEDMELKNGKEIKKEIKKEKPMYKRIYITLSHGFEFNSIEKFYLKMLELDTRHRKEFKMIEYNYEKDEFVFEYTDLYNNIQIIHLRKLNTSLEVLVKPVWYKLKKKEVSEKIILSRILKKYMVERLPIEKPMPDLFQR